MLSPFLRTVAPPPCLPLDMKDSLKEDVRFFDGELINWCNACKNDAAVAVAELC
jgi:hypothetical protein